MSAPPDYPWLRIFEEVDPAAERHIEAHARWEERAAAVIRKYAEENGWSVASPEREAYFIDLLAHMGAMGFYAGKKDLKALQAYRKALRTIENPGFSNRLYSELRGWPVIEVGEYIRNRDDYPSTTAEDTADARASHPAIAFLEASRKISQVLAPALRELEAEVKAGETRGKLNVEAVGIYEEARKFWEARTGEKLARIPNETHDFLAFFQELLEAFEIRGEARSVAQSWAAGRRDR